MTKDGENLGKFLKSDDPALVRMGLSMAKGSGAPEALLPTILGLYMWDDDKVVRAAAKTVFTMHAPTELQAEVKKKWNPSYRTLDYTDKFMKVIPPLLQSRNEIAMPVLYHLLKEHNVEGVRQSARYGSGWTGIFGKLGALDKRKMKTVSLLIKAFDDTSAEIRYKAISALKCATVDSWNTISNKRVEELLIKALEDESENVRYIAADTLGFCKKGVTGPLVKALEDKSEKVRKEAASSLGSWSLSDKHAIDSLIKLLEDKSEEVRKEAVLALGRIRNKRAIDPLIALLESEDTFIHSDTEKALSWIGDNITGVKAELEFKERVVISLIKCNLWHKIRRWGVPGLVAIIDAGKGDELTIDELKQVLKKKNLSTSGTKTVLLQRLSGQDSPKQVLKMKDSSPKDLSKESKAIAKLLESDNPLQIKKALSKDDLPEELMGLVTMHYLWNDDKTVRAAAKKKFIKQAPETVQKLIKEKWKNNYRTAAAPPLRSLIESLDANTFQDISKAVRLGADKKADAFIRAQQSNRISTKEYRKIEAMVPKPNPLYKCIKSSPDSENPIEMIVVAIDAVANVQDANAADVVLKCLDSKKELIRNAAANAMGNLGDERAIESLIGMLKDKETYIATTALISLNSIVNQVDEKLHSVYSSKFTARLSHKSAKREIQKFFASQFKKGFTVTGKSSDFYQVSLSSDESEWLCNCEGFMWKPPCKHAISVASLSWCLRYEFVNGEVTDECLNKHITNLIDPPKTIQTKEYELMWAVIPLLEIGDRRAVAPLIKVVSGLKPGAKYKYVREDITAALGAFGDPQAIDILLKLLKDKDEDVRSRAAEALGHFDDKRVVEPLIEALKDKYFFARSRAAMGLGKTRDTRAVEPLINALEDSYMRDESARALAEIGDKRAIEPLLQILEDENERIRNPKTVPGLGDDIEKWRNPERPIAESLKKLGHNIDIDLLPKWKNY